MATILTKKSDTSSSVPLAADLTNAAGGAELAVNTADKRLYSKTSGGSVVELGTNPSLMVLPSATSQPSGSANGVPYLNGSKVLTSGSALVFDGTKLGIGSAPATTSGRSVDLDGVSLQPLYTMRASGLTSATTTWTLDNANSLVTFDSSSSWPFRWVINSSERARIDSSGNLLVGTTSGSSYRFQLDGGAGNAQRTNINTGGSTFNGFFFNSSSVGSITTNGVSTAFNTSSDYRLKENIAPMTGALSVVEQLKPCTYTWKANNSGSQGFIAHELQEVVPECVTGEKDAIDADGNPVYQGIDTSFLVATLTAAVQEQQAIITALTARVAALEASNTPSLQLSNLNKETSS